MSYSRESDERRRDHKGLERRTRLSRACELFHEPGPHRKGLQAGVQEWLGLNRGEVTANNDRTS